MMTLARNQYELRVIATAALCGARFVHPDYIVDGETFWTWAGATGPMKWRVYQTQYDAAKAYFSSIGIGTEGELWTME